MKTVTVQMSAHVRAEVSTLCTCWELTRTDGVTFRWTDHDQDVVFEGETYVCAIGGFDRTALESLLELEVSNMDLLGYLEPSSFSREEVQAGLFDAARMRVFLVNWKDPSMGGLPLRWGTLGEVRTTDTGAFQAELRDLKQAYTQTIGQVTTPECTANFGDDRCMMNLDDYTFAAEIVEVVNRRQFRIDIEPETLSDGLFNFGVVKFKSGANEGRPVEIYRVQTDMVTLKFPVPNLLAVGDTLDIVAGCDQRPSTCKNVYHNKINFQGFDFLPGQNALFRPVRS